MYINPKCAVENTHLAGCCSQLGWNSKEAPKPGSEKWRRLLNKTEASPQKADKQPGRGRRPAAAKDAVAASPDKASDSAAAQVTPAPGM